jgi:5-methyltetrahydropteroyltriglutamate--homocysteine methyltransferase
VDKTGSSHSILTTTVGSYPVPDWLIGVPSEQALIDATRVVFDIQRQAGVDLPTDGELCRFDVNHPDTNGMIDYFVRPLRGVRVAIGRREWLEFQSRSSMRFRARPAAVVESELGDGGLNLYADCARAAAVVRGLFKFTITSPYMLAQTLLDRHYGSLEKLTMAIAEILAGQVADLPCDTVQLDEANVTGNPRGIELATRVLNIVLDSIKVRRAAHLCFGNYGGQTIQTGTWKTLVDFLNALHCDHILLEMARRPRGELNALRDVRADLGIGVGVIDVKTNHVETGDEVASSIEAAERTLGAGRVRWVHPDCGFWMLKRSVVDRKIEALVKGRDRFVGR